MVHGDSGESGDSGDSDDPGECGDSGDTGRHSEMLSFFLTSRSLVSQIEVLTMTPNIKDFYVGRS